LGFSVWLVFSLDFHRPPEFHRGSKGGRGHRPICCIAEAPSTQKRDTQEKFPAVRNEGQAVGVAHLHGGK
jgi:hypothetical protein